MSKPMKYAVIKTGGKQYKVSEGDIITIDRVLANVDDPIIFSQVLMVTSDGEVRFGQPTIDGLTVTGKVLEHFRGDKLRVVKYKAKVRYRRVIGHRQELSRVQIETIGDKLAKQALEKDEETAKIKAPKSTTRKSSKK